MPQKEGVWYRPPCKFPTTRLYINWDENEDLRTLPNELL
jgi:hypothetical protein